MFLEFPLFRMKYSISYRATVKKNRAARAIFFSRNARILNFLHVSGICSHCIRNILNFFSRGARISKRISRSARKNSSCNARMLNFLHISGISVVFALHTEYTQFFLALRANAQFFGAARAKQFARMLNFLHVPGISTFSAAKKSLKYCTYIYTTILKLFPKFSRNAQKYKKSRDAWLKKTSARSANMFS